MRIALAILAAWPVVAGAQLEFVATESEPIIFAGKPQRLRVAIRNTTNKEIETAATYRLYQLTATTALPVGDAQPWMKLRVLAMQTVLEDLPVDLPAVRAATRFRVDCAGIGHLTMTALPQDALKRLAGKDLLGVFDPNDQLKPALKAAKVEFADFEVEPRDVKLALVLAVRLPEPVSARLKKGMAVVWFKPTPTPAAYMVQIDTGLVVVASPATIANLAESAQAQAKLILFAELALTPDALRLPSDNQPR